MSSTTAWAAKQKRLDGMPKPTATLTMYDDPAVRDRYQAAKKTADRAEEILASLGKDADKDARTLLEKEARDARSELAAATAERDDHTVVLTFQALERGQLEELLAKYPATEEDEEAGRDYHFDTFAPELSAAASTDGMPIEYATQALKTWSLGDSEDLWNVAWGVQRRKRTDLGKG
jgi:hypothetical protein